jgi:bacteriorhodopsin
MGGPAAHVSPAAAQAAHDEHVHQRNYAVGVEESLGHKEQVHLHNLHVKQVEAIATMPPGHERNYLAGVYDSIGHHEQAKIIHDAGFLNADDPVAISFWIISIAMVAATVFFLMEALMVNSHWKTSLHIGSLVTLVAAVHYFYMREYWVKIASSPIVYRYIDWSITVPLQMIEFYLILAAVEPNVSGGIFWRLMVGTILMLVFGYLGESGQMNAWLGFCLGMAGWGFILFEIFFGEASAAAVNADKVNRHIKSAYSTMRFIVTVGWSIYPLGYFFGYLLHQWGDSPCNFTYNIADVINKIAFCLAIWHAAKKDSLDRPEKNRGNGITAMY